MTGLFRAIRGVNYRRYRNVFPDQRLYLVTGNMLAIEHWSYEPGQHYFDYEMNSRAVSASGHPVSIATMRSSLQREFTERKAITRQVIPVSIGDSDGNRIPEVSMTYREVAPQIYRSRITNARIAWSISFKSHRYVSTQGAGGSALSIARPNANVIQSVNRFANAQQMQSGHNYLALWIPTNQFSTTQVLTGGLSVTDMIGDDPPLHRRVIRWFIGQ